MKLFWKPYRQIVNFSRYFSTEGLPVLADIKRSVPVGAEKKKKEPFMKNVLLGKFDDDMLIYPEIKEASLLKELSYTSNIIRDSLTNEEGPNTVRDKIVFLAKSGLLGSQSIPKDYGGLELRTSELVTISENVRFSSQLSLILEIQSSIIQTILKHGSADIRKKYIPRILKGELIGAYAFSEDISGDPSCIKSSYYVVGENYSLNGTKRWVSNAEFADFFLVIANSVENMKEKSLSVFIVEKNDSMEIIPESASDIDEFGFSSIKFKDMKVPLCNIIGEPGKGFLVALENIKCPKYFLSTRILTLLKEMLSATINKINLRKLSPSNLNEMESDQHSLAKAVVATYVLESMIYFTSISSDIYEMDLSLESTLLYVTSCELGIQTALGCIHLLGPKAYETSLRISKKFHELSCLAMDVTTIDIHKLYGMLMGLDYLAHHIADNVNKSRNPFDFPFYAIKEMITGNRQINDNPKLTLKLYMNLHPSLKNSAEQLEYCVLRLNFVAESFLIRHASEVRNRQIDLNRIFQIASDIYAMTCVLARASRSYCTGIKHSDKEMQFAKVFCNEAYLRTKKTALTILEGGLENNDTQYLEISDDVLDNKVYFLEHPLKRNIV